MAARNTVSSPAPGVTVTAAPGRGERGERISGHLRRDPPAPATASAAVAAEDVAFADVDARGGSPLKIFEAAKANRRFLYACAPMVRYSKVREDLSHRFSCCYCYC